MPFKGRKKKLLVSKMGKRGRVGEHTLRREESAASPPWGQKRQKDPDRAQLLRKEREETRTLSILV